MTLSALIRLRQVLPAAVYAKLLSSFWRRHWRREQDRETLKHGRPAPNLVNSERAVLCEAVARQFPFSNVLELGSGFGQTFDTIAPLFPTAYFVGIDVDAERVERARELAEISKLGNAEFIAADAADLSRFSSNKFDLVISSAALLFLDPSQLRAALVESARVGSGTMLFLEQHEAGAGLGYVTEVNDTRGPYWIRDWISVTAEAIPGAEVRVEKIKNPLWTTECWQDLGCLVEIRL